MLRWVVVAAAGVLLLLFGLQNVGDRRRSTQRRSPLRGASAAGEPRPSDPGPSGIGPRGGASEGTPPPTPPLVPRPEPPPPATPPPATDVRPALGGAPLEAPRVEFETLLAQASRVSVPEGIPASSLRPLLDQQLLHWQTHQRLDPTVCSREPFSNGIQPRVDRPDGRALQLEPLSRHPLPWVCQKPRINRRTHFPDGTPKCKSGSRGGKPKFVPCGAKIRLQLFASGRNCKALPSWPHPNTANWTRLVHAQNLLRMQCTVPLPVQQPALADAPRRVYIDLGARDPPAPGVPFFDWGEGARKVPGVRSLVPRFPVKFTEVHAFEMSLRWAREWQARLNSTNGTGFEPDVKLVFHHAAAGVKDGDVFYSVDRNDPNDMAKVLTQVECRMAKGHCVNVPSVDMARWARENLRPEDFVVLKMDVEGFEYLLIPHLYKSGVLHELVDEVYLEIHDELTHPFLKTLDPNAVKMCADPECVFRYATALRMGGIPVHLWV
eukprot:Hpha_TRINITY_DN27865_c0_g1::TRINITY_DN27865_c0_g1_i1::g.194045::m.194045